MCKYIYLWPSHGPGVDQPICALRRVDTVVEYYHFDGLGSAVALSDLWLSYEDGDTIQTYEYTVYLWLPKGHGEVAAEDANHPNRFLFTGREFDQETGLYYYRARYYNPALGRFLQTDPAGQGMNWYAYCSNNPICFTDPSGRLFVEITPRAFYWACMYTYLMMIWQQYDLWECGPSIYEVLGDIYQASGIANPADWAGCGYSLWLYIADSCNVTTTPAPPAAEGTPPPAPRSGSISGGDTYAGAFCSAYTEACYGVLNAILGGLFREESGLPYILSSTVKGWSRGDAFQSGQAGWRTAEVFLLAAGAEMARTAQAPPSPPNTPRPPGWEESWRWEPPSGEKDLPWRWWDPKGGEWRYHPADSYHSTPHWDYNPWNSWNSPWQNVSVR